MGPRRSGREIPGDFAYMVAMLDSLRDFVRRLGAHETEVHFNSDDTRLAVAALLVHSMTIDGAASDVEREKLEGLLSRKFGLSGADLQLLVKDATDAENEVVDLYRFTSVLKRQTSEDERIRVIENLWEIVYADGVSTEFEENLVWRVAELLGVSARDRISRKLFVAERKSPATIG
jgi:uncharacterized tellurite resistance protein B-like protein